MTPAAPRGTRDVLPAEGRLRQRVVDVARERFAAYGFQPITTPTFEETEVFVRGVGTSTDIVRKEMYTFTDGGGRSLTLRPEGTAPVARAFVEHGMHKLPLPVKLWYLAPMFRYEAPQAGRYREHWQIGAEVLGSEDPLVDVEAIALLSDIYRRLGVPGIRLRIGSMDDPAARGAYRDLLLAYLAPYAGDLPEDARERMAENPMRLFDAKDARVQAIMAGAPKLLDHLSPPAQEHRERVLAALDALGIPYEEDPTLVRGLDYYTRTVFEFTCDRLGAQSGIGGGGRYDRLVEDLGGPPTPGVGFGAGIERICLALEADGPAVDGGVVDVYLAVPDAALRAALVPLLAALRDRGLRVESDLRGRGLKAMLRHADHLGAAHVVIVGPREMEAGEATVRDMASGAQESVPLDRLADHLTGVTA
ncbi:MAG: histidine--tRNA ligase [Actinomycetota bacterium]